MKDFKKAQKNLKNDMLVLFILELIFSVYHIISNNSFIAIILNIILTVLLFIGYKYAQKGIKTGGTIGITVGIFMMIAILMVDIINFVLGLFVLIHSIKYNELITNNKK